jgi:hypothetical protein
MIRSYQLQQTDSATHPPKLQAMNLPLAKHKAKEIREKSSDKSVLGAINASILLA